ncbi:MAG: sulfatase [Anaerolineales bacterium]
MPKRPNILYIHSHDTGRYIQPYGYDVPAPHIQEFAEEGVLFRQAFSVAPTCSPSRAGLLTGQCAHSAGMIGLAHRGFFLHDYGQHIIHTLHPLGYESTLIGVQHVAEETSTIGYDRVVDVETRHVRDVSPAAVEFLQRAPREPFFLSVGFVETHREYREPGPAEDARYCQPPRPLPDTPRTREDMAAYKATARVLDEGMGAVLDALDEAGLADDTLVICTTDHGIAFPAMKCNLTDHGIGVMLIIRGPGGFRGGKVIDSMVSHIDIFPTICELLEIEIPTWLQGTSLMPLIRDEADRVNEAIFADVTYHAAYEPKRCVRTDRWKYIRRFDGRRTPVLPNCDDSLSKDVWMEHGWKDREVVAEQLYDLVFDPNEVNNVADDPDRASVLARMRKRLQDWMERTNDPLLRGPVPAPGGSRVNDPDGFSPREDTYIAET